MTPGRPRPCHGRVSRPMPSPSGAAHGAPPSGRRRCSTWPAGHPEHHQCATICRTADRYSGERFPRQAQHADRTARATLPAGHAGIAMGETQILERQRRTHPVPAQRVRPAHQRRPGRAVLPGHPSHGRSHVTDTGTCASSHSPAPRQAGQRGPTPSSRGEECATGGYWSVAVDATPGAGHGAPPSGHAPAAVAWPGRPTGRSGPVRSGLCRGLPAADDPGPTSPVHPRFPPASTARTPARGPYAAHIDLAFTDRPHQGHRRRMGPGWGASTPQPGAPPHPPRCGHNVVPLQPGGGITFHPAHRVYGAQFSPILKSAVLVYTEIKKVL